MIGCSAKIISNALKKKKSESYATTRKMWKKTENYHSNGLKNSQNGKDSANDQLQGDQRKSKVTCDYCNN